MATKLLIKICLSILLCVPLAFADASVDATPNVTSNASEAAQLDTSKYVYCPLVESLVRDDVNGKWSAPGGWFSQHYSFAKKIDKFLGAAYSGNEIGRIECYFISNETGDARIVLKNTKLVQLPVIDAWVVSEKNSKVKVCKQNTSGSCPFLLYDESQNAGSLEDAILNIPK